MKKVLSVILLLIIVVSLVACAKNDNIFTLFAALGTASYGKRTIAELRDDKFAYSKAFWEIELITVFTTIICLVFWILFFLSSTATGYSTLRTPTFLRGISLSSTEF